MVMKVMMIVRKTSVEEFGGIDSLVGVFASVPWTSSVG